MPEMTVIIFAIVLRPRIFLFGYWRSRAENGSRLNYL
jgi:hypothetical protein